MSNGVVLIKLGVIRWTESLHFLEALFSSVKCWVPCLTESIFNWKEPTTVTKQSHERSKLAMRSRCLHSRQHYSMNKVFCMMPAFWKQLYLAAQFFKMTQINTFSLCIKSNEHNTLTKINGKKCIVSSISGYNAHHRWQPWPDVLRSPKTN